METGFIFDVGILKIEKKTEAIVKEHGAYLAVQAMGAEISTIADTYPDDSKIAELLNVACGAIVHAAILMQKEKDKGK